MEQIVYWLAGAFGVSLVNRLKSAFGLEGKSAVWLTSAVAAVLAVLAVFLGGIARWTEFTPEAVFAAFGQVLASATLAYKLLSSPE